MMIYGIGLNLGTIVFVLLLAAIGAIVMWMRRRDARATVTV